MQALTIVCEVLSHMEERQGHKDVADPVDSSRAGVTCAPSPEWVDLRVHCPWHGTHPCRYINRQALECELRINISKS